MTIVFANLGASTNPDISSGTDATSYANSSWTPPTSGLIICFVIAKRVAALDTPTISGNGLTWTQIGSTLNCGGVNHGLSLFAADASGSSTGATTVSFGANTQIHCSASFFHATGVDLSGGVAAAFVQTVTDTGTGTTGTVTLSAAASSDNRPIAGFFHAQNEAKTPRANWTEADDLPDNSGIRDLETQYRDDAFETTATATWATSDNWGGIAAELAAEADAVVVTAVSPRDAIHAMMSLPGLRGFWPLNSFSDDGDAYDLSGHNKTLIHSGTMLSYNVNELGTVYAEFDSGESLGVLDSAHFDISGTEAYVASGKKGLTFGGWFQLSSFSGSIATISKGSGVNRSYEISNASSGSAQFQCSVSVDGTALKTAAMAGTLALNQWYFLVGRFDPSTEVAFFVNKVKAVNTSTVPASLFNTTINLRIGAVSQHAAYCFLCAEVISDALLDQLYDDTLPLFISSPNVSDTVTLTETVSQQLVSLVKPAETVTLTESQTLSLGRQTSQNQAITLSEAVTVNMVRQTSQNETITLSETVSKNLVALVGTGETVTLSEAVSRNLVALVKPAETVTLTESATASMARPLTASETVTLTEGVTANMTRQTSQGETVTLSESVTVLRATTQVSQSETVTLTEAQAVSVATPAVSQNETVTLAEAQSVILTELVSQAETITLSETGTTVLLVSIVGQNETVTLSESVSVTIGTFSTLGINAAETVTLGEIVLISTDTSRLINVSELITLSEATGATLFEIVTIVINDTLGLTDAADAPLFSVTDTLTFSDSLVRPTITDTLTLTDAVTIGNVTVIVEDTLTFSEVLVLDGPTVTPPAAAATSELDNRPVLKLLYGNDKRNPIRELDLAQLAPGEIRLLAGGFAPGAGERNELWSGESIRFSGSKKLAESRKNSQLAITTVLRTGGSQAALSHAQRKTNRFFTEAKQHQLLGQNHTVWLEYRWSDGLPDLATPTFGQLSNYYEIYSATAPKWPDSLHNDIDDLSQGLIDGVVLNITGSPSPEGLKQQAAIAAGAVTMVDKGVLIASGSSSKLHWPTYTGSGLTGTFTITGWITLNAVWGSGTKYVFDYYVSASNRISIVYDAGNNRWTITKVRGGVTFTTNSATDAVTNGDDVHLQLVQDATTLHLYINGVSAASVTATATMTDGGLIALGCPGTGTIDGVDVILDGWRIMPLASTATYALALYEAELPIKEDGGQVGPPPYFLATGGAGQVAGCDDTTRDNWGIIGGVGGDLEAKTDIRLQTPIEYSHTIFYYGIRSQDETYTPSSYIFHEVDTGTNVVDATASAGSYRQVAGTFSTTFYKLVTDYIAPDLLFGKYQLFARLKLPTTPVTITPKFEFATNFLDPIVCKSVTHTGFNDWQLVDLGTVFITSEAANIIEASTLPFGLRILVESATSITARCDFLALMPYPWARLENSLIPSTATPFYVVAEDGRGYMFSDLGGNRTQELHFEYQGDPLTVAPQKYNYLFAFQTRSSGVQTITDVVTLTVYVTPRYLLPGGMVA